MKVGIVGFGMMGRQIAQVFAQHENEVSVTDENHESLGLGMDEIENGPYGLKAAVARGKLSTTDSSTVLSRIKTVVHLKDACAHADLVIEAVYEDPDLKQRVFQEIDSSAPPTALLASNTSTLTLTKIAAKVKRKERVLGMHFFNPAQATKLVEVIHSRETAPETIQRGLEIIKLIGKTPILAKDEPGFIANRLGLTLFQEASRLLEDEIASINDIDNAMKLGYGHPMGPFQTADLVGLDTRLRNLESLFHATGDQKWLPSKALREMVNQGYLGDPSKRRGSKGGYYQFFRIEPRTEPP
ncbi:3-hydroxyacyl-CoA dehydrogenase family protein [Candidatus Bathyarchaeota archaeon]|nr:MAG: 3-hydroxyacyl-CoA dehydrogenase family protein [Candidatus Bathyarchaeota archaeon]TMI30633.1 MAG: 3-hydroxyacyl-CoA dehydrogenase family protein [Candidatus Bathyarchaeota archaeon]